MLPPHQTIELKNKRTGLCSKQEPKMQVANFPVPSKQKPKMQAGNFPQRNRRGELERQRRREMKILYSRLASLLPPPTSQMKLPVPALLDHSLTYAKNLKEKIRDLEAKREELKREINRSTEDLALKAIEIIENGPILEVNLVTGLQKGFMLHKVISILEEEGAQVLGVNYSKLSDRTIYTISSQAFSSRIGINTSRVHERLNALFGIGFPPAPEGETVLAGEICRVI